MSVPFISSDAELETVISHLQSVEAFAIDLEFDKNLYHYGFNLCLVQVATAQECFIIDPLSKELHIASLFPVLENKSIQKVVFAFGEDLRLLHALNCFPKNIFELSVAWQLLDRRHVSLASFLEMLLNVKISKSEQKSNWYKRPLSKEQMEYAAQDVVHLLQSKEILENEIKKKNISHWLSEENSIFDKISFAGTDHNNFIREKDKKGLSEYHWFLFRKFIIFRENLARRYNKPNYQIFSSHLVREIVQNKEILERWEQTKGIYKNIKNTEYKEKLLKLYGEWEREALALGLSQTKRAARNRDGMNQRVSRKERMRREELKKNIILPVREIIARDYGKNTAAYILNNRAIADLLSGQANRVFAYRRELFLKYAREAGFDVDLFERS